MKIMYSVCVFKDLNNYGTSRKFNVKKQAFNYFKQQAGNGNELVIFRVEEIYRRRFDCELSSSGCVFESSNGGNAVKSPGLKIDKRGYLKQYNDFLKGDR